MRFQDLKLPDSSKFQIILCILISFYSLIYGQGRYGNALEDGTLYNSTSVSGDLYSGIDNYLIVDVNLSNSAEDLFITSTNGFVVRDSVGFLAIPEKPGKVRYTLYKTEAKDTLILGYNFFNVKRVPDPRIKIDDALIPVQGQVKKAFLVSSNSLSVHISDDIPGSEDWVQVVDFTLGYNYGGFHVSYLNASDKMLPGTRDILNKLGPDREISIKVTTESDGKVLKSLPIYRLMIY